VNFGWCFIGEPRAVETLVDKPPGEQGVPDRIAARTDRVWRMRGSATRCHGSFLDALADRFPKKGHDQTTFTVALNSFAIGELTSAPPGGNRPQWGRRTRLILPVSDCGTNA
jgi:hypothetical protein